MSMATIRKSPNEEFSIGLKFVSPDLDEGETIVSVTTAVAPSGLSLFGSPSINGEGSDTVSQVVSGGVDGTDYIVTFTAVTSQAHTFEGCILVQVRECS